MQAYYEARFEREMGCTEREWLSWLPAALGDRCWEQQGQSLRAQVGPGWLDLDWTIGEPRRLGLARLPRLMVRFFFDGVGDAERQIFMKRFDLYMQRGGG